MDEVTKQSKKKEETEILITSSSPSLRFHKKTMLELADKKTRRKNISIDFTKKYINANQNKKGRLQMWKVSDWREHSFPLSSSAPVSDSDCREFKRLWRLSLVLFPLCFPPLHLPFLNTAALSYPASVPIQVRLLLQEQQNSECCRKTHVTKQKDKNTNKT